MVRDERDRYDQIGAGYARQRQADPRWYAQIHDALGNAERILNVGAGSGNYEPRDRAVVAVEPAQTMIAQRTDGGAPVVRAVAESLPFAANTFDAAMALLTVHHWTDLQNGLEELRRVAARQLILTFLPMQSTDFWLLEYFPAMSKLSTERVDTSPERLAQFLDVVDAQVMPVPADCTDGVAAAHWRRPHAYLDPLVQGSISSLALLDPAVRQQGVDRLRADLDAGRWHDRWGHLLDEPSHDFGYRLVIAESAPTRPGS